MKHKLIIEYIFIATLLVAVSLFLVGPSLAGVRAGQPDPTPSPAVNIRTRLQPYQTPRIEPLQSDGRLLKEAPSSPEVEEPPLGALAQQTFLAIADATVLQGYPSVNVGDTADMWAGYDEFLEPDGKIVRSLVKFNITNLPPNQNITKATLRARLISSWDFPNTSRIITTYRISANWSESNVTWNNKPGFGGAYGSKSIGEDDFIWHEFDVTDLVRVWYDGTYTNHGIMLRGPEVSGLDASWRGFSTKEGPFRPELVVEYTTSTPTPPPTNIPTPTNTPTPATAPTATPTPVLLYLPLAVKNPVSGSQPPLETPTPPIDTPTPTDTPIPPTDTPVPPTSTPIPPTDTPESCPQPAPGNWSGDGPAPLSSVDFIVSADSSQVTDFGLSWSPGVCGLAGFTYFVDQPITNCQFSGSSPGTTTISWTGDFITSSTATGTWRVQSGTCDVSGTWTANAP